MPERKPVSVKNMVSRALMIAGFYLGFDTVHYIIHNQNNLVDEGNRSQIPTPVFPTPQSIENKVGTVDVQVRQTDTEYLICPRNEYLFVNEGDVIDIGGIRTPLTLSVENFNKDKSYQTGWINTGAIPLNVSDNGYNISMFLHSGTYRGEELPGEELTKLFDNIDRPSLSLTNITSGDTGILTYLGMHLSTREDDQDWTGVFQAGIAQQKLKELGIDPSKINTITISTCGDRKGDVITYVFEIVVDSEKELVVYPYD